MTVKRRLRPLIISEITMKLLSCHVENFGKLSDFSYIFEEDLNVLLAENGWGKSTLAAFLKVMFYGFEGENRRSEDGNERLRYKPWSGGTYGGSVTFSKGDREYRMHRSFGTRQKEDTLLLYYFLSPYYPSNIYQFFNIILCLTFGYLITFLYL